MKFLVKLFIYWTIIAIVGVFNNALNVQAKPSDGMSGLMKMNDPPQQEPEFDSSATRMRRNAVLQTAAEEDAPQDEPKTFNRARRESPADDSDAPKQFQQNPDKTRVKRQMPVPPGTENIPMPFK